MIEQLKKYSPFIIIFLIVLLTVVGILKNILMLPFMYADNKIISKEENDAIKSVVLDAVKDRCSSIYTVDPTKIYDQNYSDEIIQLDPQAQAQYKSPICIFDSNFMNMLVHQDESSYSLIVKMKYPESYYYHLTVTENEGEYLITFFQLDI